MQEASENIKSNPIAGSAGSALVVQGDFFKDSYAHGPVDFAFDYTFYCAIEPSYREQWGEVGVPGSSYS